MADEWRRMLGLFLAALALACGGGGAPTTSVTQVVAPRVLSAMLLTLSRPAIQVGRTATATATGVDQDGARLALGTLVWSSSNPAVAVVSADGVVTGVGVGQATIAGLIGAVSAQASITVVPAPGPGDPVADLFVNPFNAVMTVGDMLQLTASPTDAYGSELTGRRALWTSSESSVATVTGDGLVAARGVGGAIVEVTVEGVHAAAQVTVVGTIDPDIGVAIANPVGGETVGDTLKVYASVASAFPLVSVVASVGSTMAVLVAEPAGARGNGIAWVGQLDLSLLHFGSYSVSVIATDSRDHRGLASVSFQRDTRKGGAGGKGASGNKQLLPAVPAKVP